MTNGFLFEGIDALKGWQQEPGAVKLLRKLEPEGQERLKIVRSLEQKVGPKTLEHVRQNTFH